MCSSNTLNFSDRGYVDKMARRRVGHIQILSGSSKVIAPSHDEEMFFSAGSVRPDARTFFDQSKYTAFIFLT